MSKLFIGQYEIITESQPSPKWFAGHKCGRGHAHNGEAEYDRSTIDFDDAIRLDRKNADTCTAETEFSC